jgi:hypothetical protein
MRWPLHFVVTLPNRRLTHHLRCILRPTNEKTDMGMEKLWRTTHTHTHSHMKGSTKAALPPFRRRSPSGDRHITSLALVLFVLFSSDGGFTPRRGVLETETVWRKGTRNQRAGTGWTDGRTGVMEMDGLLLDDLIRRTHVSRGFSHETTHGAVFQFLSFCFMLTGTGRTRVSERH